MSTHKSMKVSFSKLFTTKNILLLLAFIVCVVLSVILHIHVEHFTQFYLPTRDLCSTRNMSYDIRGDVPIPRKTIGIMDSEIGPLTPESCQMKSLL
jgi:hypothetical protein